MSTPLLSKANVEIVDIEYASGIENMQENANILRNRGPSLATRPSSVVH